MDYVSWLGNRSSVDMADAKQRSGRLRQRDEDWEVVRLKVRTVHWVCLIPKLVRRGGLMQCTGELCWLCKLW